MKNLKKKLAFTKRVYTVDWAYTLLLLLTTLTGNEFEQKILSFINHEILMLHLSRCNDIQKHVLIYLARKNLIKLWDVACAIQ
jgi:hypothetical protein